MGKSGPAVLHGLYLPLIATIAGPLLWIAAGIISARLPGLTLDREEDQRMWLTGAGQPFLDAQKPIAKP